jgi:hypothetical protein
LDTFLDVFGLPKLNQEDKNNLNQFIKSNEFELVIKSLPTKKSPGLDGFTVKFYQMFRKELTPLPLKPFHEIKREGASQNSLY